MREIILASASPRRRELLANLGIEFRVVVPDVDESVQGQETPDEMVKRLSLLKAEKIGSQCIPAIVIAADTTVAFADQGAWVNLGKPSSAEDAERMLSMLSGRSHTVFTAFTIICKDLGHKFTELVRTEVTFDLLTVERIKEYVSSGEPMDKAGAYGIQERGAALVRSLNGSYTNVVGLPLCELCNSLMPLLKR